jgi:hypothetical protein
MALQDALLAALNAGEISRLGLARIDLAKLRIGCETQSNWLPHVLGPAMVRPGTQYIADVPSHAEGWLGEFYFSENEKVLLVMTAAGLQFLVDGEYVDRPAVTAAVTNGGFDTDLSGWTDSDESGAASTWSGGQAALLGTGTNYAFLDQQVTVNEAGTEHALRLTVTRNTIVFKVGTAQGEGDYIDAELLPGTYSLAFTPTGDFWIRIGANHEYTAFVDSVEIEASGVVSLPVPYTGSDDFDLIRYDQSGDVIFLACAGFQQRRIERRASDSRSWGLALYQCDDGPFRLGNVGTTTLTPSATSGSVTIVASHPVFASGHVGALFRMTHENQHQVATLAALNDATGSIRVSGLTSHSGNASSRAFAIGISGTFVGTVALQRSIGLPGSWSDVKTWTAPTAENYDDGLDNNIIYYRLQMTAYTSGAADAALDYAGAAQTGIARVTAFTNSITVSADVLAQFGGATATSDWAEGEWSDYRGWPAAVALHDGRLGWFPSIKTQLSVSDAFASFDGETEGDSGPINRTIATGGLDGIRWALSLQRLIVATAAQEISIRASAFDEPLTPSAFTARACSTRGAAPLRALRVDTAGIFVERNRKRVFDLLYDIQIGDYHSRELTRLKQEMCDAGVVDLAVQRQPDTRVWFVLGDGTCAVLTYDLEDEVIAWTPVVTGADGAIERVAVLPGTDEDEVHFIVNRTIGGVTKRYIERLAKRSECQGGSLSKTVDSHIVYSGASTATITGLDHLEGEEVVAWSAGAPDPGPYTVSSGQITLGAAVTDAVVGLGYTARLKTAKLAYATEHGTPVTMPKRIARIGLVMADTAWKGVRVGRDFDHMTGLPATYRGKALTAGQVLTAYDAEPSCFNSGWDADARVCIEVSSPYCCTLMGLALQMTANEPEDQAPQQGRQR